MSLRILTISRFPVKSMQGEALDEALLTERGVLGDRAAALVDVETGKVVSAKDPRRWPTILRFAAAFTAPPREGAPPPPVAVTLPDGAVIRSDDPGFDQRLSTALGRPVRLATSAIPAAVAVGSWPDDSWLPAPGTSFEFELPAGTFFDGAMVHLVTTATLAALTARRPESRFVPARFRPNLVIELAGREPGFVEESWIGRTLALGDALLRIDRHSPRCVATTLAQGELAKDPPVLRTVFEANRGNVGVYATVLRPGSVRRGDAVELG